MKNSIEKKILNEKNLIHFIKNKDPKKKLVQCHGVFDLLHIGHINYLKEAKSKGSILIVTITADKYVNKGIGRPFFDEQTRAETLAALQCVNYVFINKSLTAEDIIKKIKPNFYVKGLDYNLKEKDNNLLLEKKAVQSIKGRLIFTSSSLQSSSSLLNNYSVILNKEQKIFISKIKKKYSFEEIKQYINELCNLKVLLIGEAIIDEYVFTDVVGKSGKEPIMISKKIKSKKYAGGIIAVANHISSFCKKSKILTYIGNKKEDYNFISKSLKKNISFDFITKKNSPTIIKTRYVDNYTKNKVMGVYDINDNNLDREDEKKFKEKISKEISNYDLVLVVDYGHGLITPNIVNIIEKKSKYLALNTQLNALNIHYHSISKYKKADYICVHDGELRHDYRDRNEITESLVKKLSKKINSTSVVITKGKKGSLLYKNKKFTYCPAFANKIVDRTGAGDTLLAVTSLCNKCNIPDEITLLIGNISAANTVSNMGTGEIIDRKSILKSIEYILK